MSPVCPSREATEESWEAGVQKFRKDGAVPGELATRKSCAEYPKRWPGPDDDQNRTK